MQLLSPELGELQRQGDLLRYFLTILAIRATCFARASLVTNSTSAYDQRDDNCLAGKTASLVERLTVSTSWRRRASAQRVQTKCSWKHRDKNEERQRQTQEETKTNSHIN